MRNHRGHKVAVRLIRTMARKIFLSFLLTITQAFCVANASDYTVSFDKQEYLVHTGGSFTVQLHIDPIPAEGLYSMGVKITFPVSKLQVLQISDIIVPPPLNSDGWGGPPDKSLGNGYAGAAGAVVVFEPYLDSLILSVLLHDLTPETVGFEQYPLNVELFYLPPKTNFVDFEGQDVDSLIAFGNASVKGTVPSDVDYNQRIDLKDFAALAGNWLSYGCGSCQGVDLTADGNVGPDDLAVFFEYWLKSIPGDFNGDRRVNFKDFAFLAKHWLDSDCGSCSGIDLSGNGNVDTADIAAFSEYWLTREE